MRKPTVARLTPCPAGPSRPRRARPAAAAAAAALAVLGLADPLAAAAAVPAGAAAPAAEVVGGPELARTGAVVVRYRSGAAPVPAVAAESFVVADLDTGQVLAAKNAHVRLRPASTLKTLTAVTLLPRLGADHVYTATSADANAEGSRVGIVPGGTYLVHQLWQGLFLASGNDAASALANANGGFAATVAQMNAEAARLRALDTRAVNPSGLDADGQVSSAYDLALIARAGLAREDFASYTGTVSADFPGKMPSPGRTYRATFKIQNQNKLLQNGYPGAIGVKTGFTTLAGRTFVGAARRDGHAYVVTLMKIGQPTYDAAAALLDWAFAHAGQVDPVGALVDPAGPEPGTDTAQPSQVVVPGTAEGGGGAGQGAAADGAVVPAAPSGPGSGGPVPALLAVSLVGAAGWAGNRWLHRHRAAATGPYAPLPPRLRAPTGGAPGGTAPGGTDRGGLGEPSAYPGPSRPRHSPRHQAAGPRR